MKNSNLLKDLSAGRAHQPSRGLLSTTFCLHLICGALALFFIGCKGSKETVNSSEFRLNLSTPEVIDREVSINGGVAAPVERIQWEWGDGQADHHLFFPASHTYAKPGRYEVKVTVFDSNNRTATKSVTVEIK